MKTDFSSTWKSSKQPRKQRKYSYNAPLHIRGKFLGSHLSAELKKKHGKRSIRVVKGDKVKVLRGQLKGKVGKVETVDATKTKIFIEGIELAKKDGSKTKQGIHPSNVMITELNLNDKKRVAKLENKTKKEK